MDFKKIKAVFLDVDNTLLYLKMYADENGNNNKNGKRIIGHADYTDWLKYNITNNAYIYCVAPTAIKNFVTAAHNAGAKIYGLTECSNSFEYNAKFNRLKECYPGIFEHHGDLISVDSRHKKVMVMEMICERDHILPENIAFVDDSYQEIMEAFDHGIYAIHTTEAMERFQDVK